MSDNQKFDGANANGGAKNKVSGEFSLDFTLFTRRMTPFSARDCGVVFASLALISWVVAVAFAALGAWLILPFAGLEAVALFAAFAWIARHENDSESLLIRDDVVALAVRDHARVSCYEFNRLWARVVVDERAGGTGSTRLALRSHGREVEIDRYLDDGGRQALARELRVRFRD